MYYVWEIYRGTRLIGEIVASEMVIAALLTATLKARPGYYAVCAWMWCEGNP